jgi:hypothetical protein
VERYGADLEGQPGEYEHQSEQCALAQSAAQRGRDPVKGDRPGEAIEQAHPEQQYPAGQRAEHEIFEARFG